MTFEAIKKFLMGDLFLGAILGALVSATFALFGRGILWVQRRAPLRQLLGPLAENTETCGVFVRRMFTPTNQYQSSRPDFFPPQTTGQVDHWQNIPHVIGLADMEAATDILNVLGQVGRMDNINFLSVEEEWDLWDQHVVCVGGHYKSDRILEACQPRLVRLENNSRFVLVNSGQTFQVEGQTDRAIIYKTVYPQTGRTCILVMGLGALGTQAAGYFLRTNASDLGKMFGSKPFCAVVSADLLQGKSSARLTSYYPRPVLMRRIMHPLVWIRRYRTVGNLGL